MSQNELIGNTINIITSLSLSFVVLSLVFAIFFVYVWKTSKGKSFALVVGILVSGILYTALTETSLYKNISSENIQGFGINVIIFSILVVISTIIFNGFSRGAYSQEKVKHLFQISAFTIVSGGLFMTQAYRLLKIETIHNFSSGVGVIFGSEYSMLAWTSIALIVLFIIKTRK